MKHIIFVLLCLVLATSCSPFVVPPAPPPTVYTRPSVMPPTAIPTPVPFFTDTPAPDQTRTNTTPVVTRQPGLLVRGYVRLSSGSGLAGAKIYRAFASYSGSVIATTNQEGFYQSDFQYIPGDEMVSVWAELPGYTFEPGSKATWDQKRYFWRHYYGSEEATLDFIAIPIR